MMVDPWYRLSITLGQEICDELFELFSTDKGFDRDVYEKQMSVMRGQVSASFLGSGPGGDRRGR